LHLSQRNICKTTFHGEVAGQLGKAHQGLLGKLLGGDGVPRLIAVVDEVALGNLKVGEGLGKALGFGEDGGVRLGNADELRVAGVLQLFLGLHDALAEGAEASHKLDPPDDILIFDPEFEDPQPL